MLHAVHFILSVYQILNRAVSCLVDEFIAILILVVLFLCDNDCWQMKEWVQLLISWLQWINWQISGETVGEVRTVLDMHERKAAMAREADAFVALPGNYTI